MPGKLIQYGNGAALVIDEPVLEMLNITNETLFDISTDGRNLILSPRIEMHRETSVENSLKKVNKKYGKVLRKLGE